MSDEAVAVLAMLLRLSDADRRAVLDRLDDRLDLLRSVSSENGEPREIADKRPGAKP